MGSEPHKLASTSLACNHCNPQGEAMASGSYVTQVWTHDSGTVNLWWCH